MLFNSPEFIFLFLPITLSAFFLIGNVGHFRIAISLLVLASLFFYGYWNPAYLGLIISSVLINYAIGVSLSGNSSSTGTRNVVLASGIAFNLSLLGYFKYANFFVTTLNSAGYTRVELEPIVLPLAISFFTFQQIAYLIDAWKGQAKEYNFLHYCLFVTFFPQLIAGPIVHHKEMLPQFMQNSTYRIGYLNLAVGISIFLVGLFKKVVVADNLSLLANPVFDAAERGESLHFFLAWKGVIAYTFQLYFDFSGYSDMAIGLGRMFGIRLPLNFDSPYKATSIIEFWRRWHMTLSRFLRDYVYIPLGGSKKGKARRYINLMATMLLGGLWHGAGWTFVFWGGLHGLYLVANHAWRRIWQTPINRWWSIWLARLFTLIFVMFAWVFFRAETFEGATRILSGMINLPRNFYSEVGVVGDWLLSIGVRFDGPWTSYDDLEVVGMFVALLSVVWFLPNTQQLFAKYRPAYNYRWRTHEPARLQLAAPCFYWSPKLVWSAAIAVLGGVSFLSLSRVSEFLYFQF